MALYRQIDFNTGTVQEKLGAVGTVTGAILSKGDKGYALETGNGKYIQYDKQLLPNGAFSVVVWAKYDVAASFGYVNNSIISNSTNSNIGISLQNTSYDLPTIRLDSAGNVIRVFNCAKDKKWHCFIFTCAGNNNTDISTSALFIDTLPTTVNATVSSGTTITRTSFTYIGGGTNIKNTNISKIKVYDTVLTQKQIEQEQREFERAKPIGKPKRGLSLNKPTDLSSQKNRGLVAAYNMKPIGNVLPDISGNGKNLSLSGGLVATQEGLTFNTINRVNGSISITGKLLTVSFRVKRFTQDTTNRILIMGATEFGFSSLNAFCHIYSTSGGDSNVIFTPTNSINFSTFTYIVDLTNSSISLYQNGFLLQTANLPNSSSGTFNLNTISIGQLTAQSINGIVQDLRIYNRILSLSEIKEYHNSFVKQPYFLEDFSDQPADGTNIVPTGWIKGTGSYKVGEFIKKSGNLVVNGNFDSSVGWTVSAGWSISNGVALGVSTSTSIYQSGIVTNGRKYICTINIKSITSGGIKTVCGADASTYSQIFTQPGSYSFNVRPLVSNGIFQVYGDSLFSGEIDNISLIEVNPLPTFKQYQKYLECTTTGTITIPSDQAYGTWEFDLYKGADTNIAAVGLLNNKTLGHAGNTTPSYFLQMYNNEALRINNANISTITSSNISYIQNFTWYRVKITRTQSGIFTTYIKGGAFGNDWILVSTLGGSGTNPITDNNYTTSNFFLLDLMSGDRITNIKLTKGITI